MAYHINDVNVKIIFKETPYSVTGIESISLTPAQNAGVGLSADRAGSNPYRKTEGGSTPDEITITFSNYTAQTETAVKTIIDSDDFCNLIIAKKSNPEKYIQLDYCTPRQFVLQTTIDEAPEGKYALSFQGVFNKKSSFAR